MVNGSKLVFAIRGNFEISLSEITGVSCINSLTTRKSRQTFRLQIFKKMFSSSYIILRIQNRGQIM